MASGKSSTFSDRIRASCGIEEVDDLCRFWHGQFANEFRTRAGFCFYDDADEPNALATPDVLVPDSPAGTIMLGVGLVKHEVGALQGGDQVPRSKDPNVTEFPPSRLAAPAFGKLLVILSHEFGHIFQYANGMQPDGPWQMEPHADFMAGWLLSKVVLRSRTLPHGKLMRPLFELFLQEPAVRSILEKGDTLFDNPAHHGEPEFRAAMVRSGFDNGQLDLDAAFAKGIVMAGIPREK